MDDDGASAEIGRHLKCTDGVDDGGGALLFIEGGEVEVEVAPPTQVDERRGGVQAGHFDAGATHLFDAGLPHDVGQFDVGIAEVLRPGDEVGKVGKTGLLRPHGGER